MPILPPNASAFWPSRATPTGSWTPMMFPVPWKVYRSRIGKNKREFTELRRRTGVMSYEDSVAEHYGRGNAEQLILAHLSALGKDPEHFDIADLQGMDQLHVGGAEATSRVATRAGINAGNHVLDIGSGLGGVARHLAQHFGASVHGVELTPEFVAAATSLTRRTGLSSAVAFTQGSALAMPFEENSFDAAVLFHVGMNIQDKDQVFAEAARVLRPGSVMAVYDVMLMGGDVEEYPLPWATSAETSFLQPPLAYSDALGQAGFSVDYEAKVPVSDSVAFLERALSGSGPAGVQAAQLNNLMMFFRSGLLAPVEIYAHLD
ncbi:ubiquinone biosynthesis protein [Arthrobacter glacialis]|uniref:Ubiquinone biosynthesis protein n=2 Tax=Arthrobacter glacialis TaxID=1664 RepID=A0A2S3ZUR0_ARTGL|nr:ubiquinone biosynthesis protein [Arthrobacter glacialis]